MKNIKFITLILGLTLMTVSCDDYEDFDASERPVVGFSRSTNNINSVPEGGEKSIIIDVFSSTLSSEERSFPITTIPIADPDAFAPAAPENYSYDATVTIPANERVGSITVTGVDVSLSTDRTYFVLAIESGNDVVSGGTTLIGLRK